MSTSLALSSLLLGLAGGPHCAAMCGAACNGVIRLVRPGATAGPARHAQWLFHAGRLAGYAAAGATAAGALSSLAWMTRQGAALRPLWMLLHLAVLAWGLMLLVRARQPAWLETAGRSLWARLRPLASARGGLFGMGLAWTFMPCGLLYSALLVAALSGGPLQGALSMGLFAGGSAVSLLLAPRLLSAFQGAGNRLRRDWGTRAGGLLLAVAALWALWMDLAQRIALWCAPG